MDARVAPAVITALVVGALLYSRSNGTVGGSEYSRPPKTLPKARKVAPILPPNMKVAPVAVPIPPSGTTAVYVQMADAGNLRAAPSEYSAIVLTLPAGTRLIAPDVTDTRDITPQAPDGWVGVYTEDLGRSGWISIAKMEGGNLEPLASDHPFYSRPGV